MAVDNPNVVDFISIDAQGRLTLTISDHLPWDGPEHILLLQTKINAYLPFIEGGDLRRLRPADVGRPVVIKVVCAELIDAVSFPVFAKFQGAVCGAGYDLTIQHQPFP